VAAGQSLDRCGLQAFGIRPAADKPFDEATPRLLLRDEKELAPGGMPSANGAKLRTKIGVLFG
jgi:hypothetical protein